MHLHPRVAFTFYKQRKTLNNLRKFLKLAGLAGMGITGGGLMNGFAPEIDTNNKSQTNSSNTAIVNNNERNEKETSLIGLYGAWANSLTENKLPLVSFRRNEWKDLASWKKAATQRLLERLAV